ncbi:hypothetical protein PMLGA01_070005300, partial [Plasmodium malariae]
TDTLSEKENNKEFNKISSDDKTIKKLSYDTSFLRFNNYDIKNRPPQHPSINQGELYYSDIFNNDRNFDKFRNIKKSHTLNEKDKSIYTLVLENYINNINDDNFIFLMEVDYVDLQILKEIIYLIPKGKPYNEF